MTDYDNGEQDDYDEGLVRDVESLKSRVDGIEERVDDLQDTFEMYIEVEEESDE